MSAFGLDLWLVRVFLTSFRVFILSFGGENTYASLFYEGLTNLDPYLSLLALVGLNNLLYIVRVVLLASILGYTVESEIPDGNRP